MTDQKPENDKPRIIGYARVSSDEQNLQSQELALRKHGVTHYFEEKCSGAKDDRQQLKIVLSLLRPGDTLVVFKLDRLSRSLMHLCKLMEHFQKNNIALKSLHEHIDTSSAIGKLFFNILGSIAEFERENIVFRVKEGLAAARANGKTLGRPTEDSPEMLAVVNKLIDMGLSDVQISKRVGKHRRTIARWRERGKLITPQVW